MDAAPLLDVRRLGKRFSRDLGRARRYGVLDIAAELRVTAPPVDRKLRTSEFWALADVSFSVQPGEALAVIGHNGAGKSTLLRVLHGLLRPDAGSVEIHGTSAALIDLGAPFNRVLSGRENVATAAALQGIDRADADDLIAAVGEFAELSDVLDAPMWTYSTGMQMRLGYGIAAQLAPDLLLVDEVIAVGDIAFQRKCVSHIRRHLAAGGALVLVSHDLWMVQALCERCVVLRDGHVVEEAPPNRAISTYLRELRRGEAFAMQGHGDAEDPASAEQEATVVVDAIACSGPGGAPPHTGAPLDIEVAVRGIDSDQEVDWHVDVLTANLQACVARLEPEPALGTTQISVEGTALWMRVADLPLFPGTFHLLVRLTSPLTHEEVGRSEQALAFEVEGGTSRLETLAQISAVQTTVEGRFEMGPT